MRVFVSLKRLNGGGNLARLDILTFCVVGVTKNLGLFGFFREITLLLQLNF